MADQGGKNIKELIKAERKAKERTTQMVTNKGAPSPRIPVKGCQEEPKKGILRDMACRTPIYKGLIMMMILENPIPRRNWQP